MSVFRRVRTGKGQIEVNHRKLSRYLARKLKAQTLFFFYYCLAEGNATGKQGKADMNAKNEKGGIYKEPVDSKADERTNFEISMQFCMSFFLHLRDEE